jgi:hypothetical protein
MKSAFMLSPEPRLLQRAESVLVGMGAQRAADGCVQFRDPAGRLFTIWPSSPEELLVDGPLPCMSVGASPEVTSMQVLYIECRWEDLFIRVITRIASELASPAWIVDSADVMWPALEVDPSRIVL